MTSAWRPREHAPCRQQSQAFRRSLVAFGFVTQLVWIVTIWRLNGFPP